VSEGVDEAAVREDQLVGDVVGVEHGKVAAFSVEDLFYLIKYLFSVFSVKELELI
jgi:hypothetical protein